MARISVPTRRLNAVDLGEVLDAAPEWIRRTNLPRLGRDHDLVTLCICDVDGAGQGVAVEDQRQGAAGEDVGPVQESEMQVRARGGTGVPELGEDRAGLDLVANLHREAARLQVLVGGEDLGGDLEDHLVAADLRLLRSGYRLARGLLRLAVVGEDHGSVGDGEHIRSETEGLFVRSAVAFMELVSVEQAPVDGEDFPGFDAPTVDGESQIAVDVGSATRGRDEPTIPREGWLDLDGGSAGDRAPWAAPPAPRCA